MSSSASRKSCAGIFSEPVPDLSGEPGSSFQSESLRLGIPEALSSGGGAGEESLPRRCHCHPDLLGEGQWFRCWPVEESVRSHLPLSSKGRNYGKFRKRR
jgi:hypothetical protein